jgi:hypothetical protein
MEEKFTIKEIKNYILSQDSLGDVMYFLNADNIRKANPKEPNKRKANPKEPNKRIYDVELTKYDNILTIDKWNLAVEEKRTINIIGFWVKNNMSCNDEALETPQLDATHVVYYQK